MSLAITHFAVGGICTALVALYLLPPTRYARTLVLLGGGWGMLPDVHWVAPVYAPELKALHSSVFTNIFWFHQTLDVVDPTDSYTAAALALGAFILIVSLGDHWTYRTAERTTATTDPGPLTTVRSLDTLVGTAGVLALTCGVGILAVGSLHPGVDELRGLYLGVGTALASTGGFVLGGHLTLAPWVTNRLSATVTRVLAGVGSVVLVVGGGTLAASPLRYGLTAHSVVVASVGALLLVLAVVCAQLRLQS
ncbi:hypothetical protein DVK05_01400 [Halorubrum sp. Atlit-8R]|uniref:hypothetical protein n=1 Tax=unclassified Halorubrum TaxID=2642239 RepID=UPI000EF28004|nr:MULTISPECIES: hypothetical protein [unclassified Halorubrum]RLM71379.1 hypothetical protein DVK08_04365 [Halorubrum sp. Atlit-9R]RLM82469.1 hypothetical protein DVK05_01400 [Halorubrum sp. Atlit-8R]